MSLYDIAVGDGHQAARGAVLLSALGGPAIARFRDAWVETSDDGPVVVIYTRQGGGNRQCCCAELGREHLPAQCSAACNETLAAHPLYLRDADDDFDSTYAAFWFRAPDGYEEALAALAVEPVNMGERWKSAIGRLESGDLRPAETALMDQLGAFLADPAPGGPKIMEV